MRNKKGMVRGPEVTAGLAELTKQRKIVWRKKKTSSRESVYRAELQETIVEVIQPRLPLTYGIVFRDKKSQEIIWEASTVFPCEYYSDWQELWFLARNSANQERIIKELDSLK